MVKSVLQARFAALLLVCFEIDSYRKTFMLAGL